MANGASYGLGAYIHRTNSATCTPARQSDAGQAWCRSPDRAKECSPSRPFGGMKQSGHGRLGGEHGLHEFLQVKNVWMNLASPQAAR